MSDLYRVPLWSWSGETCVILGGGPSLPRKLVPKLKGKCRVIAVNDAGLVLAPWADILYFSDKRWHDWNAGELHKFTGPDPDKAPVILTRSDVKGDPRVRRVGRSLHIKLSDNPEVVSGFCSGSNAINLAHLHGCATIILLGFDMRPGNWHDRHKEPPRAGAHNGDFIPALRAMAPLLAKASRTVINATPGSALDCFPITTPEEALRAIFQRKTVPPARN